MRLLVILLSVLALVGCEGEGSGVVDPVTEALSCVQPGNTVVGAWVDPVSGLDFVTTCDNLDVGCAVNFTAGPETCNDEAGHFIIELDGINKYMTFYDCDMNFVDIADYAISCEGELVIHSPLNRSFNDLILSPKD